MGDIHDPGKTVVFLIGAPGSGKSTVARLLAERHGLEAFQSGRVLREVATSARDAGLRELVAEHMRLSLPMPVEVYCRVLREYSRQEGSHGMVFDGYPRDMEQCASIRQVLAAVGLTGGRVSGFILNASPQVTLARSATRLVRTGCGTERQGRKDCCPGVPVGRRTDDSTHRFLARSRDFHGLLPTVRDHFSARWPCYDIDADRDSQHVVDLITARLNLVVQAPGTG